MSALGRPQRRRPRAGKLVRASLDAALERASRELPEGQALEWSEQEALTIDRACAAADRGEQLQRIYDAQLAAGAEPGVLVKLSAELRLCERAVVDLVARINAGVGPAKSARRVASARARWSRRDARWAAARDGA
jgi:hypothetical protein